MSFSDWLRRLAALGVAAAVVFLIINGALTVWQQYNISSQSYREYQEQTKQYQRESAEKIARECSVMPPAYPAPANCFLKAIESYQQRDATNKDLKAQQDMAYWALVLTIISAIGTVLSGLAVWGVFISLRQTRIAITDTREIGEAQTRAYIGIINQEGSEFGLSEIKVGTPLEVTFCYVNNGDSPANRVAYVATCEIRDHPTTFNGAHIIAPDPNEFIAPNTIQRGERSYGEAVTDFSVTTANVREIMDKGNPKRLYLICRVEYDDVFKKRHFTNGCFYLEFAAPTIQNGRKIHNGQWYLAKSHNNAN